MTDIPERAPRLALLVGGDEHEARPLNEGVAAHRHAQAQRHGCGGLIHGGKPLGGYAEIDGLIFGHGPIVTQCGDNVLTRGDNVDTVWIHTDQGDNP
jgi:hypothetical protein